MTVSASGFDLTPLTDAEKQQRAAGLTAEERRILLNQGTEPPFCGGLLDNKESGTYVCKLCHLPLFHADSKFESGTGWPSFFEPVDAEHVQELKDDSHGMVRVEVRCARCDGHLGHVFPDGPPPTGQRYCLNSASLVFEPQPR
ncbi:MAG TPA: peptide-methionine (R)-S-oxide reductase MsrB [Alcanivorax sp.]|nr:peptide-methionine (R)-S-oxide reductase MsrB [Alcanivorax sp.]